MVRDPSRILREGDGGGGARDRGRRAGRGLGRLADPRAAGREKTGQHETRDSAVGKYTAGVMSNSVLEWE